MVGEICVSKAAAAAVSPGDPSDEALLKALKTENTITYHVSSSSSVVVVVVAGAGAGGGGGGDGGGGGGGGDGGDVFVTVIFLLNHY